MCRTLCSPVGCSDFPADLARRRKLGINTEVTIDGTWGHRFVDELAPVVGDPIIRKHRLSALTGTTLDTVLRSRGYSHHRLHRHRHPWLRDQHRLRRGRIELLRRSRGGLRCIVEG